MDPPEPGATARNTLPEWKDLAEFINKQAENDRNVINHWFRFATALLGFVLVVAAAVVVFLGWKALEDARATAATIARDAAKAKVEEVLKQPELQSLVRETARELYDKGAFRNEIEAKVRELISAEIATPESRKLIGDTIRRELVTRMAARVLTDSQKTAIAESLRSSPSGQVTVKSGPAGEQRSYAKKLYLAITASLSWRDHVSLAPAQGSWEGMTARGDETEESLGGLSGIVIVVNDKGRPPDSAHQLEGALEECPCCGQHSDRHLWLRQPSKAVGHLTLCPRKELLASCQRAA
jgi:hypothetical protein